MNDFYLTGYITPNDPEVMADSDSLSIQRAVDRAKETGVGTVCIPAMNARTKKAGWTIDRTVLLPSDMTVLLNNCHMTMADDVTEGFFRSENVFTDWGRDAANEMQNIRLIGIGNAVLDGGKKNDLDETTSMKEGHPHVACNHPILFLNVRNFTVENLTIIHQRYWGMRFEYCRFGRIANIHTTVAGDRRNQDGINLRNGCNNIVIENITGQTGDDMIALSAIDQPLMNRLKNPDASPEEKERYRKYSLYIENANQDIHTVIIRNITGSAIEHPLVAMRNNDGAKLYNILVENVMDLPFADPARGSENQRYALIRIGNNHYWSKRLSVMGETYGITVRNIRSSCSKRAITIGGTLRDAHFSDIGCFGECLTAVTFNPRWAGEIGGKLENILVDGVCVACSHEEEDSCALDFSVMRDEDYISNLYVRDVHLTNAASVVRVDGKADIRMENVSYDSLRKEPVDFVRRHPDTAVRINGKEY